MPEVELRDVRLHYELAGSGEPVLLLHGLGGSGRDWEGQVAALSRKFQVISMDVRGHGRSQKPPGPYSMATFAQDAAGLIERLRLGPVHVVGLSLGGMIGFQLALDAPSLVRSLTVLNSGPAVVPRTLKEKLGLYSRFLLIDLFGLPRLAAMLSQRLLPLPEQAALRNELAARLADNDPAAYKSSLRALIGWSVLDRIGALACPVLIVASDMDYTPIALKQEYMARIRQAALVVIRNSRHACTLDQPEQVNQALSDFLSGRGIQARAQA